MNQKTVYLDHAAATPMDETVISSMAPYFKKNFYNPSATYLTAKAVAQDIAKARSEVASWLGAKSPEIIFTAGGTEANNLAIKGVMEQYPGANLIVSAIEHESVLEPAKQYHHQLAPVKNDGIIDLVRLEKLINTETVLISIMYANNEVGTIQPLKQISKIVNLINVKRRQKANKLPLYLHTDACQAPAYLNLYVSQLGVDLMTLNSGKIYGPKQVGALFVSRGVTLKPQILGGGQEMGLRSGTENVANIIGFACALGLVQERRQTEVVRLAELQGLFVNSLGSVIKTITFNGSFDHRLPSNIHITLPGHDNETMLMKLDEMGVQCASGSACNAINDSASNTLLAMGLTETQARSSLRFTMGQATTKQDIIYVVDCISKLF